MFLSMNKKLCTTFRELFGIVYSLTKNGDNIIASDLCNNVLNDHKPIFSCFTKKGNICPIFYTAQKELTKFRKFVIFKRKENFLTDKLALLLLIKNCNSIN